MAVLAALVFAACSSDAPAPPADEPGEEVDEGPATEGDGEVESDEPKLDGGRMDAAVRGDAASSGLPRRDAARPAAMEGGVDQPETRPRSDAGSPEQPSLPSADGGAEPRELAVSADFLNRTLTVFDVGKLAEGKKRADVMVATIDLSKYSPGPLSLGITPDGKTAVVSISAGFLGSFIDVPAGRGTLVFVDLEKFEVSGELYTGESPMGVVFSKDGKRAFVGHFSENYFAVVDMEKRTFERVNTGSGYNEELSIDDSGTVGILTYGPAGNVKTFGVADPAGTLGQTNGLSGDAAGVAFFPGTKYAYLVQAPTVLTGNSGGHNVILVEDPKRPVASDNVRMGSHPTCYPVTAVHARSSIAYPITKDGRLSLVEKKLEGSTAKEVQRVEVAPAQSLAYGVTSTRDGRVLLAVSGERYIAVVDLATKKAFTVPWEVSMSGPTEVKVVPQGP